MLKYTLLDSFLFISKYYGKDISKNMIMAQLPKFDGDIPYQYITRISQKLSLEIRVTPFDKDYISNEFLPLVVKSNDDKYAVLLKNNGNEVILTDMSITDSTQKLSMAEFLNTYSNNDIVLIRRSFDFNKSNNRFKNLNPQIWFKETFFKNNPMEKRSCVCHQALQHGIFADLKTQGDDALRPVHALVKRFL